MENSKDKKMEKKRSNIFLFYILLCFLFVACNLTDIKFEKEKWNERDDIFYAYREKMVKDLMKNHLKKGMTYKEVIELLGEHGYYQYIPSNTIGYEIMVDYGWNIDPQKGKTLYIEFTEDSTIKEFRLEKWKH